MRSCYCEETTDERSILWHVSTTFSSTIAILSSPAILTMEILNSTGAGDTVLMGRSEAKATKSLGKKGKCRLEIVNALIFSSGKEFIIWRKIIIMWIHRPQHPSSSSRRICSDQSLFLVIVNCKILCQRNHLSYMQAAINKRSILGKMKRIIVRGRPCKKLHILLNNMHMHI